MVMTMVNESSSQMKTVVVAPTSPSKAQKLNHSESTSLSTNLVNFGQQNINHHLDERIAALKLLRKRPVSYNKLEINALSKGLTLTVTGGVHNMSVINGEYHHTGTIMNGAGVFAMKGSYFRVKGSFTVYRCRLGDSASHVWFLSFVSEASTAPGEAQDHNLYFCEEEDDSYSEGGEAFLSGSPRWGYMNTNGTSAAALEMMAAVVTVTLSAPQEDNEPKARRAKLFKNMSRKDKVGYLNAHLPPHEGSRTEFGELSGMHNGGHSEGVVASHVTAPLGGAFRPSITINGFESYTRDARFHKLHGRFVIYKRQLPDKSLVWLVAFCPEGATLGGKDDMNLYYCDDGAGETFHAADPRALSERMTVSYPDVVCGRAAFNTNISATMTSTKAKHDASGLAVAKAVSTALSTLPSAPTSFSKMVAGYASNAVTRATTPANHFASHRDLGDLDYLKDHTVIVSGSKILSANGEYTFVGLMNSAAYFELRHQRIRYMIYRAMKRRDPKGDSLFAWQLACVPLDVSLPGTDVDRSYYTCEDGKLPDGRINPLPCAVWKSVGAHKRVEQVSVIVVTGKLNGGFYCPQPKLAVVCGVKADISSSPVVSARTVQKARSSGPLLSTTYSTQSLLSSSASSSFVSPSHQAASGTDQESDGEEEDEDDESILQGQNELSVSQQRENLTIQLGDDARRNAAMDCSSSSSSVVNVISHDSSSSTAPVANPIAAVASQLTSAELDAKFISFYKKERFFQRESLPSNEVTVMDDSLSHVQTKALVVSGAAYTFANGVYHYVGLMNRAGHFEMQTTGGRYAIYRCFLCSCKKYSWFLSFVPHSEALPGSDRDCNLYYSGAPANCSLPIQQWKCMTDDFLTDKAIHIEVVEKESVATEIETEVESPHDALTSSPVPLKAVSGARAIPVPSESDAQPSSVLADLSTVLALMSFKGISAEYMQSLVEEVASGICDELKLDMSTALTVFQLIVNWLHKLRHLQSQAQSGVLSAPHVLPCDAPDGEDKFAGCLRILSAALLPLTSTQVDEQLIEPFEAIEALGGGLSEEGCLVPMHALCLLLLGEPQRVVSHSVSRPSSVASTQVTHSVDSIASEIAGNKMISRRLEDDVVKLFKFLFPKLQRNMLPHVDKLAAMVDHIAKSSNVTREVAVNACAETYECLREMSERDLAADKRGAVKSGKFRMSQAVFKKYTPVLHEIFPFLTDAEVDKRLDDLLRVTIRRGVAEELAHLPLEEFCAMLRRRLEL